MIELVPPVRRSICYATLANIAASRRRLRMIRVEMNVCNWFDDDCN